MRVFAMIGTKVVNTSDLI